LTRGHLLEERMTDAWRTLGMTGGQQCRAGWTGLAVLVRGIDASGVIEADLKDTEFSNYTRIYCEDDVESQSPEPTPLALSVPAVAVHVTSRGGSACFVRQTRSA